MNLYNICIVGNGHVATALGMRLKKAGHKITQIVGRNIAHSAPLAKLLSCPTTTEFQQILPADIYLICVSDKAINDVAKKIIQYTSSGIIAHTSGITPLLEFNRKEIVSHHEMAVFYPFQTFSECADYFLDNKYEQSFCFQKEIPIFVESKSKNTTLILKNIASSISKRVSFLSSSERQQLHLAGVWANNFTNHCIAIAQEKLTEAHLPEDWILPMVETTLNLLKGELAKKHQSGPAVRGDSTTIDTHLDIETSKEKKELYTLLTKSIIKVHCQENNDIL